MESCVPRSVVCASQTRPRGAQPQRCGRGPWGKVGIGSGRPSACPARQEAKLTSDCAWCPAAAGPWAGRAPVGEAAKASHAHSWLSPNVQRQGGRSMSPRGDHTGPHCASRRGQAVLLSDHGACRARAPLQPLRVPSLLRAPAPHPASAGMPLLRALCQASPRPVLPSDGSLVQGSFRVCVSRVLTP